MSKMTPELLPKIEHARAMLYLHSYLSESENERVRRRIRKACDKAGMDVKRVSLLESNADG